MDDLLYKGHFKGIEIAFSYVVASAAVNEMVILHDCDPAAAHILARATAGTLLVAAVQAEGNRVNTCWQYEGHLRSLIVDAGQDGGVRSLIAPPHLDSECDDRSVLYGDAGNLRVVVSHNGKIVNSGTTMVPFQDEINDLSYFCCTSDQVETSISVMVGLQPDVEHPVALCQGWMVQALPNCDLELFERVRRRMDDECFRSRLGKASQVDGYFEEIANTLVGDEPAYQGIHMNTCNAPHFECTCSREKMRAVLLSIATNERMEMVKKGDDIAIRCQFCNKRYLLTIPECINAWNHRPLDTPSPK